MSALNTAISIRGEFEEFTQSWSEQVHHAALNQPMNIMTLYRLRDLEKHIRNEAEVARDESIEQVEAIALVCAYKLKIMRIMVDSRERQRHLAVLQGRVRYVD